MEATKEAVMEELINIKHESNQYLANALILKDRSIAELQEIIVQRDTQMQKLLELFATVNKAVNVTLDNIKFINDNNVINNVAKTIELTNELNKKLEHNLFTISTHINVTEQMQNEINAKKETLEDEIINSKKKKVLNEEKYYIKCWIKNKKINKQFNGKLISDFKPLITSFGLDDSKATSDNAKAKLHYNSLKKCDNMRNKKVYEYYCNEIFNCYLKKHS